MIGQSGLVLFTKVFFKNVSLSSAFKYGSFLEIRFNTNC